MKRALAEYYQGSFYNQIPVKIMKIRDSFAKIAIFR